MLVIIGLILLIAAIVIAVAGVLTNGGSEHAITDDFSILGYHVTGSTGTLFLFGVVVGAVGVAGLALLLAGARRSSRRGAPPETNSTRSTGPTPHAPSNSVRPRRRRPSRVHESTCRRTTLGVRLISRSPRRRVSMPPGSRRRLSIACRRKRVAAGSSVESPPGGCRAYPCRSGT